MKNYQYTGVQPHNSTIHVIVEGKKVKQDLRLVQDQVASLPEDHSVIKALVRQGHLVEVKSSSPIKKQ